MGRCLQPQRGGCGDRDGDGGGQWAGQGGLPVPPPGLSAHCCKERRCWLYRHPQNDVLEIQETQTAGSGHVLRVSTGQWGGGCLPVAGEGLPRLRTWAPGQRLEGKCRIPPNTGLCSKPALPGCPTPATSCPQAVGPAAPRASVGPWAPCCAPHHLADAQRRPGRTAQLGLAPPSSEK